MAQTGAIFNSLIFGNVDSANYGIYITGEAVYNAPERAVEAVNIPGRNGALLLDQGYWENIEITYPAGTFADNAADFADAICAFRNAIASQVGYQRLTDAYNPNEYRMAVYSSGLEVDVVNQCKAGEFEITFNAKPQRWLLTGENKVTVANNDTVYNPTKFDSSPLLEVTGYGNIEFNGYNIDINNETYGNLILINKQTYSTSRGLSKTYTFDASLYNAADYITIPEITLYAHVLGINETHTISSSTASDNGSGTTTAFSPQGIEAQYKTVIPASSFAASSDNTISNICTCQITPTSGTAESFTTLIYVMYTASTRKLQFIVSRSNVVQNYFNIYTDNLFVGDVTVNSTANVLGTPTYIDCDLGEAYRISNGETFGLNAYVDLGSNLPKLAAGSNTVTFNNTVTDLKIVPRWWQL